MSIPDIVLKIKDLAGKGRLQDVREQLRMHEWWGKVALIGMTAVFLILTSFWGAKWLDFRAQNPEQAPIAFYPPPVENGAILAESEEGTVVQEDGKVTLAPPLKTKGDNFTAAVQKTTSSKPFAASKSGKVYYPASCKGLSRVKEENRVYFATEQAAKDSGRTLSKGCS